MHSDKDFRQAITDEMILAMYQGSDEDFARAKALAWVLKKLDEEYPTITHKDIMVQVNGVDFLVAPEIQFTQEVGGGGNHSQHHLHR